MVEWDRVGKCDSMSRFTSKSMVIICEVMCRISHVGWVMTKSNDMVVNLG